METIETIETLEIIEMGDPILRQKSKKVPDIFDEDVQTLIDDMMTTLHASQGVGLAAPQVGHLLRLFVVAAMPSDRYPDAKMAESLVVINPILRPATKKKVKDWEGCLSIPGIRGQVPRFSAIDVEFTNRIGERHQITVTNFVARVFQHENDHLDGILFLDRMKSIKDLITDKEYFRLFED